MKAFDKDVLRTIGSSKKRFFSIMIICALGVTMFVGLAVGCLDLRRSADKFFDEQGLFDVGILSTLGLTDEDVEALGELQGVAAAEGAYEQPSYTEVGGHQATVDVKALSEQGIKGGCPKRSTRSRSPARISKTAAVPWATPSCLRLRTRGRMRPTRCLPKAPMSSWAA